LSNDKLKADAIAQSKIYHDVFVKNEQGAKIFQQWIEKYCFNSFTVEDATLSELAKAEARREFVCMIINKINLAENSNV